VNEHQVSQEMIAEMDFAVAWQVEAMEDEEDSMGDHDDLPNCRKFLQLRRLHEKSQPLEQWDEVIENIRRLMIESTETASKEALGQNKGSNNNNTAAAAMREWSEETAPEIHLGSRTISSAERGSS